MALLKRALHSLQIRSQFLKFIWYFIVLLVSVALLCTFIFQLFLQRSQVEKEVDRANFEKIENTRIFTDTLLRNIDTMTLRLANQSAMDVALRGKNISALQEAAANFGSGFAQNFPASYCVNSIYVYIKRGGFLQVPIVGAQSTFKIDSSEIMSLVGTMNKEDHWLVMSRTPGSIDAGNRVDGTFLVLVRPIPLLGTSIEGAIIVVLDPTELFPSPFLQNKDEKLWIVLPDGSHAYEMKYGTQVPEQDFGQIKSFYSSGAASFHATVQTLSYSFRISNSSLPAWKYVYGVSVNRWPSFRQWMIGLFLVLVTDGAAVQVARKAKQIQHSITTLRTLLEQKRQKLQSLQVQGQTPIKDEFSYLIGEVNNLVKQRELLTERLEQSEVVGRISFIRELLTEPSVYAEQRMARLRQFGLPVMPNGFLVIVFRIDDYVRFVDTYSQADQKLLRYFISKLSEEQLADRFLVIPASQKEQDVVLIVNLLQHYPIHTARNMTVQAVNAICQYVHSYLQLTVSVGIGDVHDDIGCVSESYQQAQQALEFRIYKGFKALIPIWHIKKNHHQIMMRLYDERKQIEQEWIGALRRRDRRQLTTCLKKMEKAIKELDGCSLSLIHHTLWELILIMLAHSEDSGPKLQVMPESLHNTLAQFQTLDEIIAWMEDIFSGFISSPSVPEDDMQRTTIDHILDYIQVNHDKDISLNGIADQLQLDPSYLSRLFKQEVGMNFIDYLVQMRLKRAKILLLTTDHSIQDISAMVGYNNVASFNRVFKKVEDVTPGQFRARHESRLLNVNEVY